MWGLLLEPVVRARFEIETGRRLRVPKRLTRRKDLPWQAGHLDGLDDDIVYEGKTARTDFGWGEPGSDDIPPHHKAQVWHYMAVANRRRAEVAVLIGGQDFRRYALEWDDSIDDLTAEEQDFRESHILPRIPPEFDGSPGANRWLRSQHPTDDGSDLVAMPEQYGLLADFVNARHRRKIWEAQEERLKQAVMGAMGDASRLLSPMVRVTYALAKDKVQTDWKSYTAHMEGLLRKMGEDDEDIEATRGLYTSTEPGSRRFNVYVPKLELEDNG